MNKLVTIGSVVILKQYTTYNFLNSFARNGFACFFITPEFLLF